MLFDRRFLLLWPALLDLGQLGRFMLQRSHLLDAFNFNTSRIGNFFGQRQGSFFANRRKIFRSIIKSAKALTEEIAAAASYVGAESGAGLGSSSRY